MRKSSLLTVLFLMFSFIGFAQEWHGITSDAPSQMKKTLISSTENETVIEVNLGGFYTQNVKTPNGEQVVVSVKNMAAELEAGVPQLPYEVIPVMIGDLAEMKVAVVNSTYVDYENVEVAPSKGNFSRQINPDDVPYTYGAMYQKDAFWPASQVSLDAPYIIRDLRGQNIWVRPFAYNPMTKTLRVYTNMTIAMTKVSNNGENQKVVRKSATAKVPSEFKASYNRRFINFEEASKAYPWVEDNGELLVICADQFMASMQPFVDWKNQSGRPTTMVSVTQAGGNNDTQIKNYINSVYNDPDRDLAYVLFVGDYQHITPHSLGSERSDNWFGQLVGSDHYPEVFIGRFSVQTDAHVTSQVNKVLYYERDLQSNVTWGDKGLGIGSTLEGSGGHYGEYDNVHIDHIRDTLLHYTYSTVTDLHQGGSGASNASAGGISNVINGGVSIINYCNHGSETSWGVASYSTSNVNALTNDNMWPIVWSVACLNGKFDQGGANGECFAEAWMRATNNSTGVPTGAIGGMFSWMSQPWQPPMYGQDEMDAILCEWRHTDQFNHTLAGASLNGDMAVIDKSGSSGYDCHDTWILFGDPTLLVRTTNPTEMNITTSPAALMLGMDQLTVNADADYAIATLSMDGEIIASGKIVDGSCTFTFPALNNVGTADLVVIGYNKVTYQGTIDIVSAAGAYLTVNASELSAPANYGESVDLSIEIKNVGVETVNNITVTLSTDNEYINISAEEGTLASLEADEIVTIDGFQFEVADNVEDGTRAQINVTMTAGDETWTGKIMVDLHAPVVALSALTVDDQAVTFTIANNGSAPFHGCEISLTSCSPDLIFDPASQSYTDDVEGGTSIDVVFNYEFDPSIEEGSSFEVAYEIVSDFLNANDIINVVNGTLGDDFESGSFSSDWTFNPNNAWTITNGGTKGTKCAKASNTGMANTEYSAIYTVNIVTSGNMTFMYKVSCEQGSQHNWDYLKFEMDNVEKGRWDGQMTDFEQFTQAVTPGTHVFKWTYRKDSSVNTGDDCAWIDDIKFPPTSVFAFIEPASNLMATVEGQNVNLSWSASADAVSYLVKRDGEAIATVTETGFVDEGLENGTYRYSVYAIDVNGSMSVAVTELVTVEFTALDETMSANFGIYPNPAENVLNIKSNASSFDYQMINSVGQVVISGKANGKAVIDLSDVERGVYFLKVIADGNTKVEKVVLR